MQTTPNANHESPFTPVTPLSGHTSQETAYVVDDYPYGFKLRCKIRFWLETNKNGTRFVSQTTNPKKSYEVWNKPKASTYARIAGAMFLSPEKHVHWENVTEYTDAAGVLDFVQKYQGGSNPDGLLAWALMKTAYCRKMSTGEAYFTRNGVKIEETEESKKAFAQEAEVWRQIVQILKPAKPETSEVTA